MTEYSTSIEECEHPEDRQQWLSGEVGIVVTLNGPVAAICLDCGAEATLADADGERLVDG
jgi:hypothetical protein